MIITLQPFLQYCSQSDIWQCPICFKPLPFEVRLLSLYGISNIVRLVHLHSIDSLPQQLRINQKMSAILSQVKPDISKVKLQADGSYVAVPPEVDRSGTVCTAC